MTTKLKNSRVIKKQFNTILGAIDDSRPIFRAMERPLKQRMSRRFTREVDPYGKRWTALSPVTIEKKQSNKILTETRKLRKSFHVTPKTKRKTEIGFTAPYAGFHQTGTSKMPQRQLLPDNKKGLPRWWERLLSKTVTDYLKRGR